ncbi:class I SAM-dependent methyltransferase [Halobellus captivus]|uniref:SAM-dependent methyltransferase n=1 Tax=Halobellus captivus TaxID=2592614 RepID=UPI0011A623F5|nr:SAM-dependent methyltransferase [Halobellus captivus]
MNHARARYLESKRSVDDRALAPRVTERMRSELDSNPTVVEVGCGTGATVPRLLAWGIDSGEYHGVDTDETVVSFARRVRPMGLERAGYTVVDTAADRSLSISGSAGGSTEGCDFTVSDLRVTFEACEAIETLTSISDIDLVVAQSFADLVSLPLLIDAIEAALRPGGLAYLPITFDGGTIFQPDHPADESVERAYHAAIDDLPGRDVHAGRHLADLLRRREGELIAMASSDWIVRPQNGSYPDDERYFLGQILRFVEEAISSASAEPSEFDDWLATRRRQLDAGELLYVAHGYDLLYRTR